jgi:ketosteroid isomerase-like protein
VKSIVICLLFLVGFASDGLAQSQEQEIRALQKALVAAVRAGDRAALDRLYADDLRWMDGDSGLLGKPARLAEVTPVPSFDRTFDTEIRFYGDVAVETGRMIYLRGGEKRQDLVSRVYIRRNGQWQLLSHAAIK